MLESPPEAVRPQRTRTFVPLWAAFVLAAGSGPVLDLAFPDIGWWPMVFVGVAMLLVSLIGRSFWMGLALGSVAGMAFYLVNLAFISRYLGPVPWVALAVLETFFYAFGAAFIALLYRWSSSAALGRWWRLIAVPLAIAAIWTSRETVSGSVPYGGFAWGRMGLSQSESPVAHIASWVGVSGVSFLIVAIVAAIIEWSRVAQWRDLRTAIPALLLVVVAFALPAWQTTPDGTFRVASVQGNGPAGYFDERSQGDVLAAQVQATLPILDEPDIDVLLWPEGGSDIDPLQNKQVAALLDRISARIDAPMVLNAITERDGKYYNTSMQWVSGLGAVQTYDKRFPVPFGEYVPDRPFFQALAPDLIDLIGRDYTPGTTAPVFEIDGVVSGLAICFDVISDRLIWEGANDGAELYMFQTNNADFRGTDENQQQLAIARMRAIETGRSAVNISTVGASQVIAADGSTVDALPADVAGHMVTDVELRTGLTPAVVLGLWVPGVIGLMAIIALSGAGILALRQRRAGATAADIEDDASAPMS